jgi:hypothetical protein
MPRAGSDAPNPPKGLNQIRQDVERARRLADDMTNDADRRLLNELADKLEAEADEIEGTAH